MFFDPLYLELMRHQTAFMIGITLICVPVIQIFVSIFLKQLFHSYHVITLLIFGIVAALLAAICHLFFTPTITIYFVLFGLLLMGFNWGISNVGVIAAMSESIPTEKMGATMGTIFTFWNVSGSIFLALGTVLFHYRETIGMGASLTKLHVALSADEQQSVNALLADPNQIHTVLTHFQGAKTAVITQVFQTSFMGAYHLVMAFSIVVIVLILMVALRFRK